MTLTQFFLSPVGRITRHEYWLGLVALMALSMPISIYLEPELLQGEEAKLRAPGMASTVWSLLVTWPSTMISWKRFNDRDRPVWIGAALGVSMVIITIAHHLGYFLDPKNMSGQERMLFLAMLVFFTWALIDNGFFKGTDGPNRYGPDPLANQPRSN